MLSHRCWLGHCWGMWGRYTIRRVQSDETETRQRRECGRCGKTQDEHVSYGEEKG